MSHAVGVCRRRYVASYDVTVDAASPLGQSQSVVSSSLSPATSFGTATIYAIASNDVCRTDAHRTNATVPVDSLL